MNPETQQDDNDIKGALLASIGEVEEKTPGATGDLAKFVPEAKPEAEVKTPPEQTAANDGRERGPDGKFLAKDTKIPAEAAKTADATKSTESAKTGAVVTDAAPGSLPADIKAEWAALTPATKAFLVKQEQERGQAAGKAGHELRQLKQQYEPIETLLGPRRAAVVAQHGSVEGWLKQVLDYSDFAGADPEGFLSWYLSQPNIASRVDVAKLLGQSPDGAQRTPALATDPTIKGLQQRLEQTERRLQQYEGLTQTQRQNSVVSEMDAFENEKDAQGNLAHPHYATLREAGVIGPELHLVQQSNPNLSVRQVLATAYENAMWKHSDTRNAVLQSQQKQALEEKEAKDRAEAASRARKFATGSSPGKTSPADAPKENVRDEIAALVHAQMGSTQRL